MINQIFSHYTNPPVPNHGSRASVTIHALYYDNGNNKFPVSVEYYTKPQYKDTIKMKNQPFKNQNIYSPATFANNKESHILYLHYVDIDVYLQQKKYIFHKINFYIIQILFR